jgi:hypothetical protein
LDNIQGIVFDIRFRLFHQHNADYYFTGADGWGSGQGWRRRRREAERK